MVTYVTLYRFTQDGVANIKASPSRLAKAKKAIKAAGGKLKAFYLTMGQYDLVAVSEWPDDETAAQFLLMQVSEGNVTSETLRAFDETAYRKIIGSLP